MVPLWHLSIGIAGARLGDSNAPKKTSTHGHQTEHLACAGQLPLMTYTSSFEVKVSA